MCDFRQKNGRFAFLSPLRSLTYNDHLSLIGKRIVDFLLVQVEGVTPTIHFSSQKTRLNDLSYGIKYGQIFLPFCHNTRV